MHAFEESDSGRRTDELLEQGRKIVGGEQGGKAADQGEHSPIQHEPDTERGTSVTRMCGCAKSSKGTEEDEVHRLTPPFDSRVAHGKLLRTEAEGRPRSGWRHVA